MTFNDATTGLETAGGYGPPGGGGYGGPPGAPPGGGGGGGYGGPPGAPPPGGGGGGGGGYGAPPGGYGGPPAGGGGYGGPPGGGGYGPPPGQYDAPPGGGFGPPGFGPPGVAPPRVHPLAIVSLVAGILSIPLCCCSLLGSWAPVLAVVCGVIGMNKIKAEPALYTGTNLCIGGIATGGVGLVLQIFGLLFSVGDSLRNQYGHF